MPENTLANDHRPAERGFDGVAWQERADVYSSAKTIFFYGYFLFCFVSFLRVPINKILNKVVLCVWLNLSLTCD